MRLPISKLIQRFVSTTILIRLPSLFIHLLSYCINLCQDVILRNIISTKLFYKTVKLLSALLGSCFLSTTEERLLFSLSLNNPTHALDYQFENTDVIVGYGKCHCCHSRHLINSLMWLQR